MPSTRRDARDGDKLATAALPDKKTVPIRIPAVTIDQKELVETLMELSGRKKVVVVE